MKKVIIPKTREGSLTAQLKTLYDTFRQINFGDQVEFDLSNLEWACPMLILPLCSYLELTKSRYRIPDAHKIKPYLDTIKFPQGVKSAQEFSLRKSYIPVSVLDDKDPIECEKLESCFLNMIYKVVETTEGAKSALYYPISELTTNIFEHSKGDKAYVFGQYYPSKDYLDMCIVDTGRGLTQTYKDELNLDLTDEEAIKKVMIGLSIKQDTERGFGVRTSKRVVCEGMQGGFVILSGNTVLMASAQEQILTSLDNFYWQGVIVAYRIPKPEQPVDIYQYVD